MKKIIVFLSIGILIFSFSGCAEEIHPEAVAQAIFAIEDDQNVVKETPKPSNKLPEDRRTIKLPDSIIKQAVSQCQDKDMWGISLAKVEVNYIKGAVIDAAIVLHNGNDAERLVTISYQPIYSMKLDASTDTYYEPAPIDASGWVSIDNVEIRMDTLETIVVPIHLFVPYDYTGELPEKWEFNIRASGIKIQEYQYTIKVTTVENDTVLECHIPQPLLDNKLDAIKSIISTNKDEFPLPVNYDSVNGILTIHNLKESTVRELTIIYEYGDMVVIDYVQRWLITMASG